jgi:hypothetical protein
MYGHGVLGGLRDAERLVLRRPDCTVTSVGAGLGHVFEDVAPRLTDMDGDGVPEVVAVRSSLGAGAQLAVYADSPIGLALRAQTPYIGTRHRWLAPAAWGDLDGDGAWEVAFVDRPHLARRLWVYRWGGTGLAPVASLEGVTNHRIGEEAIAGAGPVEDAAFMLATPDWARALRVRLGPTGLTVGDAGPWPPTP